MNVNLSREIGQASLKNITCVSVVALLKLLTYLHIVSFHSFSYVIHRSLTNEHIICLKRNNTTSSY